MGNRAVITTAPFNKNNIGIYLHWNGGRSSVEGFLAAARELEFRDPAGDTGYAFARLASLICLFFGLTQSTSVGVDQCKNLDCDGDNGVYLVGENWQIVGRKNHVYEEQIQEGQADAIRRKLVITARLCETACKDV